MKIIKLLMLLSLGLGSSACERIEESVQGLLQQPQHKPQLQISTLAQDQKAAALYTALQAEDLPRVTALLDKSLQQQIKNAPSTIEHMFRLIPAEAPSQSQVVAANHTTAAHVGPTTTVIYLYEYPKLSIVMTVVFQGDTGGDRVLALVVDQLDQVDPPSKGQDAATL
ncbi:hypothetical protein EC844_10966 [Acinetobacter calcoaceticus]|uniref:DUF3887 domain-containing protein n=1 Tax=Acinetobacter calcoaceticus TaxID=471 RepID=A0A4R1XSF0_ACICA|nr:hypothetical protein EC844_10966 [Acinetobacter calcoaceticus]